MNWFRELTGFDELDYKQTREQLQVAWGELISPYTSKKYLVGEFDITSLGELKRKSINQYGDIKVNEVVADVQKLHIENPDATFQVASQFNALEMVSPEISPLDGVTKYEWDLTQGPACAIACGAGTVYRNYFVDIGNYEGQDDYNQLNMLDNLESKLPNLWTMKNGYLFTTENNLNYINKYIENLSDIKYEDLLNVVKVGVHSDVQVTIDKCTHTVNQIYCSALPISYNEIPVEKWEIFAKFILESMYEATIIQSMENYLRTGNNNVFLTLLGGGAFGNKMEWIIDSLEKVLTKYKHLPLDVKIVSFGKSNKEVNEMIKKLK